MGEAECVSLQITNVRRAVMVSIPIQAMKAVDSKALLQYVATKFRVLLR
jgi:hypothetical protein